MEHSAVQYNAVLNEGQRQEIKLITLDSDFRGEKKFILATSFVSLWIPWVWLWRNKNESQLAWPAPFSTARAS